MFKNLNFVKVEDARENIKIVDLRKMVGMPVIGRLIGVHETPSKFEKMASVWTFLDGDDNPFIIYGKTRLNRLLEVVPPLSVVRITHIGVSRNPKTGQEYHNFTVAAADQIPEMSQKATAFLKAYERRNKINAAKYAGNGSGSSASGFNPSPRSAGNFNARPSATGFKSQEKSVGGYAGAPSEDWSANQYIADMDMPGDEVGQ
jgi:hypothetical protein